jgi:hypothetical protein
MDDDLRGWLFDPLTTHGLVLAHRPAEPSAMRCVVSDVVWDEVVQLLRWATAGTGRCGRLDDQRWWRLAARCAELLRRLPSLADEVGEPWRPAEPVLPSETTGTAQVAAVAARLARLLRTPGPLSLQMLAPHIDALGAAAVSAMAEQSSWAVGEHP